MHLHRPIIMLELYPSFNQCRRDKGIVAISRNIELCSFHYNIVAGSLYGEKLSAPLRYLKITFSIEFHLSVTVIEAIGILQGGTGIEPYHRSIGQKHFATLPVGRFEGKITFG